MRRLMGSGCRTCFPIPLERSREFGRTRRASLIREFNSKIFPPTPEDLPAEEKSKDAEAATAKPSTEEAPVVSGDATDEPQAKKVKTSTEDLGKDDWEAIEKPNEASSDHAADMSKEGETVEAVELGGSDGKKVEKLVAQQEEGTGASVEYGQPENKLAKDW